MKTDQRAERRAVLAATVGHTFWGFSFLASRTALNEAHMFLLLSHRFLLAFAAMNLLLLAGAAHLDLKGKRLTPLLLLGLAEPVIYFFGEQYGILHSNTIFSGVMIAMIPIVSMLAAMPALKERPTAGQLLFSLLSVGGVVGVGLMSKSSGALEWGGVVGLLVAVLAAMVYTLLGRGISGEFTPFERTYVMIATGAAVFTACAAVHCRGDAAAFLRPLGARAYLLSILFLALCCSVGSYFFSSYAITYMTVARETVFANLTTAVSVFAGAFFLREPFSPLGALFCAMILLGIYGVQRAAPEARRTPRPRGSAQWERTLERVLMLLTLPAFFSLNLLTPVMRDDWSYTFNFVTKERIASLADIFQSLGIHYVRVNGRLPAHFLAHLFLWLGKGVFNVVNTLAFAGVIVLVCFHACGSLREIRPHGLLAAFFALWMLTPAFGESFLWVTGASNYLYGMLMILLYLVPFRRFSDAERTVNRLGYIPLALLGGILAGWTNENTGGALLLVLLCFLGRRLAERKSVPPWFCAGLLGCAAGLALMVLAPGELSRLNGAGGMGSLLDILRRALRITFELARYLWPLFVVWALLLVCFLRRGCDVRRLFYPLCFLLAGLAAAYAMALAPQMPARIWSGPTLFLVISTLSLHRAAGEPRLQSLPARVGAVTLCAALCLAVYALEAPKLAATDAAFDAREAQARALLADGVRDLSLDAVRGSGSRFDAAEAAGDVTADADYWVNVALARYLGADSVVKKER